jgi:acylphosphatase
MVDPLTRLHLVVSGRVQGVGFRWFTREQAEARALAGWTRNLRDGTVECEVEGPKDVVAEFVEALKTQHPFARVDAVEFQNIPPEGGSGFEIR